MAEELKRLEQTVNEIRTDVQALTKTMSEFTRIEERVNSLYRMAEKAQATEAQLWSEIKALDEKNHKLAIELAKAAGGTDVSRKLTMMIVGSVFTICASIIGANMFIG